MKRNRKTAFAAVLLVISIIGCIGCGGISKDRKACEKVIETFQAACNDADVNGMLDCVQPSAAKPLKVIYSVGSVLVGGASEALNAVLNLIAANTDLDFGALNADEGETTEDILKTLKIEPTEYDMEESSATVTCKICYTMGGSEKTTTVHVDMIKQEDTWYIKSLSL